MAFVGRIQLLPLCRMPKILTVSEHDKHDSEQTGEAKCAALTENSQSGREGI